MKEHGIKGILAALVPNVIFGFSFLFSKIALDYAHPLMILAIRFTVAFAVLNILWLCKVIRLDFKGKDMEIRSPFVPGKISGEMEKIAIFLSRLSHVKGVRILPYHNLSGTKYASLGINYTLNNTDTPLPKVTDTDAAAMIFESYGIKVLK